MRHVPASNASTVVTSCRATELERTLGAGSLAEWLRPKRFDTYQLSFDPDRIPLYAACEYVFLTAWLSLLLLAAQRVRSTTLAFPLGVFWLGLPTAFAAVYSPAFMDGDWFMHRVAVEHIALWGLPYVLRLIVPAGVSLVLYVALRSADALARDDAIAQRRYRKFAVGALCALALGWIALRAGSYYQQSSACLRELEAVCARLTTHALTSALTLPEGRHGALQNIDMPEATREAIGSIVAASPASALEVVILARTDRKPDEHLFLRRSPGFVYADFRAVPADFGWTTDADFLQTLAPEPSCSGVVGFIRGQRTMCGRRARLGGRDVTIAVKSEDSHAHRGRSKPR